MTSPYLEKPKRSHQEVTALRDGQPDLKFFGDGLQQALHNHIAMASFIRRQTKDIVAGMKRAKQIAATETSPEWVTAAKEAFAEDLNWLQAARRAHSKAILDREAYRQAINERDIGRELGL